MADLKAWSFQLDLPPSPEINVTDNRIPASLTFLPALIIYSALASLFRFNSISSDPDSSPK